MTMPRKAPGRHWISFLFVLDLILLWELAIRNGTLDRRFIPQPSEIARTLLDLSASGELWNNLGISFVRITLGFLIAAVVGIPLGLLMGINPTIRALIRPVAALVNPIPKIALIPFVVFALKFTEWSFITSLTISILPLLLLDTMAAVARIEPKYFEVARNYGASRWDTFWTVALPASMPSIVNSIKLDLAYTTTLIIGVEIFGAQSGIGKLIWDAANSYRLNELGAGIVALALTGWLIFSVLDAITPTLIPWQPRPVAPLTDESPLRRSIRIWWLAARPWSFTASLIPVLLGAMVAAYGGKFNLWLFALTLVGSVAIHAGTNLINDYYDYKKGADTEKSLGQGGAIQKGQLTPRQVFFGGVVAFALGSIIGLYLVSVTGPFILFLGVLSVLAGFFYTAGPAALAYIGLGEITVFIFMGPVMVIGAYYVQAQRFGLDILLASLPIGFLVAAILHANNLRDLEEDRAIGKRTLATILGRSRANLEYYILVGGTYLSLLLTILLNISPWYTLVTALTLPAAVALMRRVSVNTEPAALNPVLRKTAQLHMRFGMLLIAGWVIALFLNLLGGR
jgi:1,4-dihydroxy-2-naphthoate polyprenyltransferase